MRKVFGGEYFDATKYTGLYEFPLSGRVVVVTGVREGEAVDREGVTHRGWLHTVRDATAEEIDEAKTPLTAEDRASLWDNFFERVDW